MTDREQQPATSPVWRLATLRRVVLGCSVLVAAIGGAAVWRAVDRLDEAWARYAVVQGEMADLEALVGDRLDRAAGVAGPGSGSEVTDAELEAQVDDLFRWAETVDDDLAAEILDREGTLSAATADSGSVDEVLVVRLESTLREVDRQVVRPVGDRARAAHDTARRTILVVAVSAVGLAATSVALDRRRRAADESRVT